MNKSKFKSRLVIGSANFTQKYGVNPIKINYEENIKILKFAKKNGINQIDTADAYLGKHNVFKDIDKDFKFSTKVTPDKKWTSLEYCQKKIEDHFKYLNSNSIETLLFHSDKILFTKNGKKIFKNLELLKKKKYFKKIGISIYDTSSLKFITSNYNLNVVQCPYNFLDRRIITSNWFDKLKSQSIEIHARSVFLKGILVNKSLYKKKYFNKWKNFFKKWFKILEYNKISPVDYCLNDLTIHDFDKIIIGVNNHKNLRQIVNFKIIQKNKMISLNTNDKNLIDPRRWK